MVECTYLAVVKTTGRSNNTTTFCSKKALVAREYDI